MARPGRLVVGHFAYIPWRHIRVEEKDEVVIEDCGRPRLPQMWGTRRFLTVNGPLWVIRSPEIAGSTGRKTPVAL